jgi:glycosyltransferase involved in cell wall biosynthesis
MRLSVIVSTYNSPPSLLRALLSLEYQTYRDFEVVVADDGSGPATADVVDQLKVTTELELRHLWHPDRGFRKNTILNRAVLASRGEYLVFLDGDCVARRDLIATHVASARPNQLLSGGSQIDLPEGVQAVITREAIAQGLPFRSQWLRSQGVRLSTSRLTDKYFRLECHPVLGRCLDRLLPRAAGFVGCNSSAWKADILRVNGFDENIEYGVDDKDLGIRLINAGIRSRRLKYSLVYLHLAHQRSYADPNAIRRNKQLVSLRRQQGVTWIETGIWKGPRRHAA